MTKLSVLFMLCMVAFYPGQTQQLIPQLNNLLFRDVGYVLGATLLRPTVCAPGRLVNWKVEVEALFQADGSSSTSSGYLNSGIWKAPVSGFYQICASGRVKTGGNGDITINKNPNPDSLVVAARGSNDDVIAAFGSDCPNRCLWSTHQICFISFYDARNTLSVNFRSGWDTDCLEVTPWPYSRLDILLIQPITNVTATP